MEPDRTTMCKPPNPYELGRIGEDAAVEHLSRQDIVVLSRNWRSRDGELDIVATDSRRLIVCEVKTRSGDGFGTPAEAITPTKVARIRRLTQQWMRQYRVHWVEIRFDVISVRWEGPGTLTVEHDMGAF